MKSFKIKPIFNKNNKQVNFSLPKKKLTKAFRDQLPNIRSIKIKIEDFDIDL